MDEKQAIRLVKETFESRFDRDNYIHFLRELLNGFDDEGARINQGGRIPEKFQDYVEKMERVGKYSVDKSEIILFIVYLKKETSIERARTMQRNFVAWYLARDTKDAALVAFISPDATDWRFSLVKMDYRFEEQGEKTKVKEEFTPARRWSFLVGANEKSHTAQSKFVPIIEDDENKPSLETLEDAFNIEKVTKEFFEKYRDLFIRTKGELDKAVASNQKAIVDFESKGIDTVNLAKKLLGQIIFLYYLQKKGWFGVPRDGVWGEGSKNFLRERFAKKKDNENFFNDILEHLFYDALRNDRSHDDHYYGRFNCKIPFLNGGLFDPMNNYDWVHTDILLPDSLFSNKTKTKEGDEGDGILDVFDRYNFTVKEDEPFEKEVAIDPELLGKAYEKFNAIRPDNYDEFKKALNSGKKGEESKFNKQYGVYYTPREIVHYMCQQSLINYLYSELNPNIVYQRLGDEKIDMFGNAAKEGQLDLTIEHYPMAEIPKEAIALLIQHGESLREHEAQAAERETKTYSPIIHESIRKNAALIDQKLAEIKICDPAVGSGAFPVGMMSEIVRARDVLKTWTKTKKTVYHFKRECIENSLYGVDIDPGAVEIAKLRLWLSLIVDEDDIQNIKPLPNLDYKVVCGNSLVGVEKNLFNLGLFTELEKLKPLYFNATNPAKKQEYKKKIDSLIDQITNGRAQFDFEIYFSEVFHEKDGFDVVIANPPYISHDKITLGKNYLKEKFRSYEPFADIYCYFIEKGIALQNKRGTLTFITSNSYLRAEYGSPLRKLLRKENELLSIINLEDAQIFEDAIVNVAILVSAKNQINRGCFVFNQSFTGDIAKFAEFVTTKGFYYTQKIFASKSWGLIESDKVLVQQKIEKGKKTLEQLGAKIRLGLATGNNDAFVIDKNQRKEFIKLNRNNSEIIKPILRGRDIFRYSYEISNQYILLTKNGVNVKKDYPDIYNYLDGFGQSFKKRGAQGQHWTNLRAVAFFEDFKKSKIVWIELTDTGRFALCEDEIYLLNSAYFLLPPLNIDIKYLLGVLNSRLIYFYLGLIAETSGMGVNRWINNYVKEFPIVQATVDDQKPIIKFVDRILAAKRGNPQADTSAWEREIDQLVYQLYGLTKDEVKIVEGNHE